MEKEKSSGVIIFREEEERKYLLLHYESRHWDFVKGNIEEGETERKTAVRESQEETGITDIEFFDKFKEEIQYYYKKSDETILKHVVFLLGKTSTEEIKLSYEHIGYKWLSFEKALKQVTYNNAKEVLEKAEKFIKDENKQKRLSKF